MAEMRNLSIRHKIRVDDFNSWVTQLGTPLRESISLITRQLELQLQVQLQQIAAINIFDVPSVAAASDYLMHLHIWPQNSEKAAESWHVATAPLSDCSIILELLLGFN